MVSVSRESKGPHSSVLNNARLVAAMPGLRPARIFVVVFPLVCMVLALFVRQDLDAFLALVFGLVFLSVFSFLALTVIERTVYVDDAGFSVVRGSGWLRMERFFAWSDVDRFYVTDYSARVVAKMVGRRSVVLAVNGSVSEWDVPEHEWAEKARMAPLKKELFKIECIMNQALLKARKSASSTASDAPSGDPRASS